MAGRAFVPFEIIRFPTNRNTLRTTERRPRGSVDEQADPVFTILRFRRGDQIEGFDLAGVTHRKGVRVDGIWHGNPIDQIVKETRFEADVTGVFCTR